jgi:HAD superfamily hydrolase (TIGR01549 family)
VTIRAVLFDWRGTLVADPPPEWWYRHAAALIGRELAADEIARLSEGVQRAFALDEVKRLFETSDCSYELNIAASRRFHELCGMDSELGDALDAFDLTAAAHPFFPDAQPMFRDLKAAGLKIAVVSNIHFDVRPEFAAAGLEPDAYVLSFEHGFQKPDPRMFTLALEALNVEPGDALMVGDSPTNDGAAARLGILTIILPRYAGLACRGLDCVTRLVSS